MILFSFDVSTAQYNVLAEESHLRVRLSNGSTFSLNEEDGKLAIHVDGQLVILPKITNGILLDTKMFERSKR
jgi:hypothetical protein